MVLEPKSSIFYSVEALSKSSIFYSVEALSKPSSKKEGELRIYDYLVFILANSRLAI